MNNEILSRQTKGVLYCVVSGISFGLIPLFSVPVIKEGMGNESIIVYRFLFGSMAMLLMLLMRRVDMKISFAQLWRIALLSVFYIFTAIATLECYKYLSTGIATALVYTDPIFCAIIGLMFLGDRFSWRVTSSIILATVGVMLMTGVFAEDGSFSLAGLLWGLCSGLAYALYLLFVPRLKVKDMPSLKLTFYVFFTGMLLLALYCLVVHGGVEAIPGNGCWVNLVLLGIIPTALSVICVTASLKLIDSTVVAILGAFEPLTAMVVGVLFLDDPCTLHGVVGALLILLAVAILTVFNKIKQYIK